MPAFEHLDDDHASAATWARRADLVWLVGSVLDRRRGSVQVLAGAGDARLSGAAGEIAPPTPVQLMIRAPTSIKRFMLGRLGENSLIMFPAIGAKSNAPKSLRRRRRIRRQRQTPAESFETAALRKPHLRQDILV
jgi:hypothetical protein